MSRSWYACLTLVLIYASAPSIALARGSRCGKVFKTEQRLAKENGDDRLRAVRINFDGFDLDVLFDYSRVLRKIPDVELWIVSRSKDVEKLKDAISKFPNHVSKRMRLISISDHSSVNPWTQDGSKPLEGESGTLIPRKGTGVVQPDHLSATLALKSSGLASLSSSPLRFEGGNVVVGARHVFVGPDVVAGVMRDFGRSREEATRALSREFGKKVIELGHSNGQRLEQVDFHLDLSLAIARDRRKGDEVALIDSPYRLLEDVLGLSPVPSLTDATFRKAIRRFRSKLGSLTSNEKLFFQVISKLGVKEIHERERKLTALASRLESEGYRVLRVPGTRLEKREESEISYDTEPFIRFANYINVILSAEKAIVPNYDIRFLDSHAHRFYRELGYEVIPVNSPQFYMSAGGGIRCLSETFRY